VKWNEFVSDYLTFSRKERIAVLAIAILILFVIVAPKLISHRNAATSNTVTDTSWISAAKKLEIKETEGKDRKPYNTQSGDNDYAYQYDRSVNSSSPSGNLFYFDPNTLDQEGWKKLGLRDKTIHTIQNYLSKGGRFKKPEDLQRIYGLFPNEYERIAPYIKIEAGEETKNNANNTDKNPVESQPAKTYTSGYSIIEINSADTAAFVALPGIGSKLAARIVNFRDKLGGFYSINQIGETYSLPDSTFQKIKQYLKLDNSSVKKININTATKDEMKAHPYIKWNLANIIVEYRNQHGNFNSLADLKKISAITDSTYLKIVSYFKLQ
jgi:competence ComEA-like helix-hairpin-helix protein